MQQAKRKAAAEVPAERPSLNVVTGGAPAGVRRVNLGGLGLATSKTSGKYPLLPDPTGVIAHAVDQYCAEYATFEALEGSLKTIKGEFSGWARPFYYQTLTGRLDIPSSVLALSESNQILLTFQDRYPSFSPDWEQLGEVLGNHLPDAIAETFDVKIDGSKLPPATAQQFIEGLTALANQYGAASAITAKLKVKPLPGFHSSRHAWLSPEQNLAFDAICPAVMAVKTKGVKR